MKSRFQFSARIRSFKYAFRGIWVLVQSQHNAWIHALATVIVVITGLFFHISVPEWCWLILVMMLVWVAEALNTAIEFLADATVAEYHPLIEKVKDIAAGAVLITAIGAVIIGALIFYPYFKNLVSR